MNDLTMRDEPQSERPTNPHGESYLTTGGHINAIGYDSPRGEAEAPSKPNAMRDLSIREVNRGFIVQAGCHTFAISTAKELTQLVTEYINDPSGTEKRWFDGTLMTR